MKEIYLGSVESARDSEIYIHAICAEFEWDAKVKEHFLLDQNAKSKKIHLLLGLKNCGHMMEPVRAEQFNSIHPAQLPDMGIWRSPLTTRMMLTGRIVVNKELVTKDLPLLNTHVDKIEEYKSILKESELVDRSYEGANNADLE